MVSHIWCELSWHHSQYSPTWTNANQIVLLTKCCTFQFSKILSRTPFLQSNRDSPFSGRICRLLEPCWYHYSSKLPRSHACGKRKKIGFMLCGALVCRDSRTTCRSSFALFLFDQQKDKNTDSTTDMRNERATKRKDRRKNERTNLPRPKRAQTN